MLAAVISDTHLRTPSKWLAGVYDKHLAEADVLLHCGDTTGEDTWAFFNQHPVFHAVAGNTDEWGLGGRLPNTLELDLNGFHVGMVHGWGDRPGVPPRVADAFGGGFDLVCYGHTHSAFFGSVNNVTLLNPGTLQKDCGPSLALVTLEPGRPVDCRFVSL